MSDFLTAADIRKAVALFTAQESNAIYRVVVHPQQTWYVTLWGQQGWRWRRLKAIRELLRHRHHFSIRDLVATVPYLVRGEYP